jgi:hypothetical protein
LQQWEQERWTWARFRRLPADFQVFAALGALAGLSAVALVVSLLALR